jgi:hypothetical protein
MGYNQADIVVGGDHGQRRFRAVIKLILRNNGNNIISPYSVVIRVGNIECRKDTREVLQKTIGPLLNDSLCLVVDKFIVIHYVNDITNVILADEPPALNQDSEYNICLATRSFMAGDLSFYHAIIGKENMSTAWCTWCKLSKAEWSAKNHKLGDPWTIEELNRVCDDVECGRLNKNKPNDIKGVTLWPLFDAIPIRNYILSMLHIIIGVGNSLVDFMFEWIESRVEQLTNEEVAARNSLLYAMIKQEKAKEIYETWIENDGMAIVQKRLEKNEM